MSELVVIAYPDEHRAAEAYAALRRKVHPDPLFDVDAPVALYVTKDRGGEIVVHRNQRAGPVGAMGAAGLLLGLVCALPLAGAVAGAGAGLLMARGGGLGLSDELVAGVTSSLVPGSSALFLLLRPASADETLGAVGRYGGTVLRTSLPTDIETRLEQSLAFWNAQQYDRDPASDADGIAPPAQ